MLMSTKKKPSYEELLARHEKRAAQQAENSRAFVARKRAAGLRRVTLWVPEAVDSGSICGVFLADGHVLYLAGECWKKAAVAECLKNAIVVNTTKGE